MIDFDIENMAKLENRANAFKHKEIKIKFSKQKFRKQRY